MFFRNIGLLISAYDNTLPVTLSLPQLINDTDMSVPTGSGTITDPWVYNSLNTLDSSTAIGTHDLGIDQYYLVAVTISTSSETTDVATVTFEHSTPVTPISIGGDPNNQSVSGYLVKDIDITSKYTKDAANSVGSDTATFTLGACDIPYGNFIIDTTSTNPHWIINNTLSDIAISDWGTISNSVQIETYGHQDNLDQNMYLIAQTSGTCFWDITVDSDPLDVGYLYLNGVADSNLNGVGGSEQNRTGSFTVVENDIIRIRYLKNSTVSSNLDRLTVNSLYIN